MTARAPTYARNLSFRFWAATVEVIVWCGGYGGDAYYFALTRMMKQIEWRRP